MKLDEKSFEKVERFKGNLTLWLDYLNKHIHRVIDGDPMAILQF